MYFRLLIRKPGPQICCISYRNQSFDLTNLTNQMTGFYMKCNLDKVTLALTPSEVS